MQDIYDPKKCQWYKVERGLLGLKLTRIVYEKIRRAPTPADIIFEE